MRWQIIALLSGNDLSPSLQVGRRQLQRLFGKGKWQVKSPPRRKLNNWRGSYSVPGKERSCGLDAPKICPLYKILTRSFFPKY